MNPVIDRRGLLSKSELRELLVRYRKENWHGIQTPEWQARIVESILEDDGELVLNELAGVWELPARATVLDIGSGVGTFVLACRRKGLLAFGVEPDRIGAGASLSSIQIARRQTEDAVFAGALGEHLPFPDGSFDLVSMNQVIEHVSNQEQVFFESARVLRQGGAIFLSCPNYLRFYELHYKIFWLPLMPKFVGRLYLRARGRDPVLLNQLKYTTNARLRKLISKLGPNFVTVDLNRKRFAKKCEQNAFLSAPARAVARITRWPIVGRWMFLAALMFLRYTEAGCEMIVIRKS